MESLAQRSAALVPLLAARPRSRGVKLHVYRSDIRREPGDQSSDEFLGEEPHIFSVSRTNFRYDYAVSARDFDVSSLGLTDSGEARLRLVLPCPSVCVVSDFIAEQSISVDPWLGNNL